MKMKTVFCSTLMALLLFVSGCGKESKPVDVQLSFVNQSVFNSASACTVGETFDWISGGGSPSLQLGKFKLVVMYPDGAADYYPLPGVSFDVTGFVAAGVGALLSDYIQFPSNIKVPVVPGTGRKVAIEGVIYHHQPTSTCSVYQSSAPPTANCNSGTCNIRGNVAPIVFTAASGSFDVSGANNTVMISSFEAFDTLKNYHKTAASSVTTPPDQFNGYGLDGFVKDQSVGSFPTYTHSQMPTSAGASFRPSFLNTTSPFSWIRIRINNATANTVPSGSFMGISFLDKSNLESNGFIPFPIEGFFGKRMLGFASPTSPLPTFPDSMQAAVTSVQTSASSDYKIVKIWPLLPGRKYQVQFWGSLGSGDDTTSAAGQYWNGVSFASHSFTTATIQPQVNVFGAYDIPVKTRVGAATCIVCSIGLPTVAPTCVSPANIVGAGTYPCSSSPFFSFNNCAIDNDDCR